MKKFLLLMTVILITSCSNEIDRSQAEQLLKKEIGYPYLEYNQAKWDIWYFQDKGKYVVSNPKGRGTMNLKNLVDNGLIDLSNGSRKVGFFSRQRTKNTYRYSLSKKSKDVLWDSNSLQTSFNYWLADLPMYEIDLNEVTGIKFEDDKKTKATIEFTEKKIKTSPFTALSRNANRQDLVTRTAKAELYDDGWRITFNGLPNKIKVKSLEKVSGWNNLFESTNNNNNDKDDVSTDSNSNNIVFKSELKNKLFDVKVTNLRVRNKPTLDGEKIDAMNPGDSYTLTGNRTVSKTTVEINGGNISEYWYETYLETGDTGWIHGCCISIK